MSLHGVWRSIALSQDKCGELRKRACAQGEDDVWITSTACVSDADADAETKWVREASYIHSLKP